MTPHLPEEIARRVPHTSSLLRRRSQELALSTRLHCLFVYAWPTLRYWLM